MAIHMILGVLGAGKGRYTIEILVEELKRTNRFIFTNFAVESLPWVNGLGKLQLGLEAYCLHRLKSPELLLAAQKRVLRVPDEIIPQFFLYRAVRKGDYVSPEIATLYKEGIAFDIYKAKGTYKVAKDGEEKILKFDLGLLAMGPICYIVDEAWKFWPAREWESTSKAFVFYAAHSRKTGDELWLATHSSKDLDSSVVRKCQDFHLCVNRGKRRIGWWRQPDDIKVRVYSSVPTGAPNEQYQREITLKVNPDGIAECYDTTGGIGVAGRMVGDMGEKKRGFPMWTLYSACFILPALFFAVIWLALRANHPKQQKQVESSAVVTDEKTNQQTNSFKSKVVAGFVGLGANRVAESVAASADLQNDSVWYYHTNPIVVTCSGYTIVNGNPVAWLSDGSELDELSIAKIEKRGITGTNGIFYRMGKPPSLKTQTDNEGRFRSPIRFDSFPDSTYYNKPKRQND